MAIGAAPRGAGSLARTIHIWPSPELIARSWDWPLVRHEAFERILTLLALAAATCILDGRPFGAQHVVSPVLNDHLTFSVECRNNTVIITITDFRGSDSPDPDWPGPGGGTFQPKPVDGLALGLRGSGRYYRMVVFHGFMAPVPATNILNSLFLEFNSAVLFKNEDAIPCPAVNFLYDTASVANLSSSTVPSLDIEFARDGLNKTPLHLPDLAISPGSIAYVHGRKVRERLNGITSERQRDASRAVHGHALRIRQWQTKTRQGAPPPGRQLH